MYFYDNGIDLEITSVKDEKGREVNKRVWIDGMDLARAITNFEVSYEMNEIPKATITFFLSSITKTEERP